MDGGGKVPHRVQRAFEADPPKAGSVGAGGLLHQEPAQVISDPVHESFLLDEFRAFTTQDVEARKYLDLVKVQFDFPALRFEYADGIG